MISILSSKWCKILDKKVVRQVLLTKVIISAKVSHHSGKVSHLQKLGGFVCKCTNLFDISLSQRFSLEFKTMCRS